MSNILRRQKNDLVSNIEDGKPLNAISTKVACTNKTRLQHLSSEDLLIVQKSYTRIYLDELG